jgi:hypothetical protein
MPNRKRTSTQALVQPLGQDHLEHIDSALRILSENLPNIDLAEKAGEDVSEHRRRHKAAMDQLMLYKSVYFPGQP